MLNQPAAARFPGLKRFQAVPLQVKLMRARLFLILLVGFAGQLSAQSSDSTLVDQKGDVVIEKLTKTREINPKRALLWSIVPGGGQVYNRRWWKVPIVYGTFAGMVAAVEDNQRNFQRFKKAYLLKLADEPHEFVGTSLDSETSLRSLRDSFDKNRQTAYVGLVVVYFLQGVEAFVDAHLRDFDIDEDLSLRVQPKILLPPTHVLGAGPLPVLAVSVRF